MSGRDRFARCRLIGTLIGLLLFAGASRGLAAEEVMATVGADQTLTNRQIEWPTWDDWRRVLLMRDYNTRVVVIGTALLGMAAGMIGSFTLLRKRALMGDALSHATLPGIGLAFMIASAWGGEGKSLWVLLLGGGITGVLGVVSILLIRNLTRLKEDAALGIVLSVFFGGGVAVLGIVQNMPAGHAAGLEGFIYGKTASMISSDAWLIGIAGLSCAVASVSFYKELKLICFDEEFAGSRGFSVVGLDLLLMGMVTVVTIIGLQAVGLILMIALLVIPAAAARFWTERMSRVTVLSAVIGAVSCMSGAAMSAIFPRLPSGAMIVLVSALMFLVSMFFGTARGVLVRGLRRRALNRKIDRQHLLRGLYEYLEQQAAAELTIPADVRPVPWDAVFAMRSWNKLRLGRCVRRAAADGFVVQSPDSAIRLTAAGLERARRLVHDHRLWEMYLITHADVAPSRVDRDADAIEHVLDAGMIARLEVLLKHARERDGVPASPHATLETPVRPDRITGHRSGGGGI